MAIGTVEFDLSMVSPQSGEFLTARTYTVEGVENADGSLRQLSIGQLVMAICLNRASKLEADIIALMEEMSATSAQLAALTDIENDILDGGANMNNINTSHVTYDGQDYTFYDFLVNVMKFSASDVPTGFADGSNTDELVLAAEDDRAPVAHEQARPELRHDLEHPQEPQYDYDRHREQHVRAWFSKILWRCSSAPSSLS